MAEDYVRNEALYLAADEYLLNELHAGSDSGSDPDSNPESEDETENYMEEEEDDEEVSIIDSPTVPATGRSNYVQPANVSVEEERPKRRRVEIGAEKCGSNGEESREGDSQGSQWNQCEIDGLFCPICMEAWTSEGDHHICCLPCGHLFGLSCIKKWIQQQRSAAKCPQCNRKCTLKDIRKLFAPRIAVVDQESQKRIQFLEVKCDSLEKKGADWHRKESEWKKREAKLQHKVNQLTERTTYLEQLLGDSQSRLSGMVTPHRGYEGQFASGHSINSKFNGSSDSFLLQKELRMDGARLFDIDASGQILLVARRLPNSGSYVLTKMSLIPPHESDDIVLPSCTKTVKDLCISPFNGNLALYGSLGKQLSVLSTESNNANLFYNLPAAAWSCSWDLNSSHYIYAGLQNGSLLVFDIRQTAGPLESRLGLTTNPIHTIHSLRHNETVPSGERMVLSASSVGICQWNFGGAEERPSLVPEAMNQGVCISLAYCPSSDDIVASYRPKVEMSNEMALSQPLFSPSPLAGQGISGSHLYLKRVGSNYQKLGIACATVSDIRLPKSTIIDMGNQKSIFAAGDETTHGLTLQELPSFTLLQHLKPHKHFVCDVRYTRSLNGVSLGCLSEDTLQLFSTKLP